ncbi:hypothetical protein LPB79_36420 (plasmid) [Rhizobium sp. T136]|nr:MULTISPECIES: hypothetical protein [Rhizobium]MCS0463123.1 hypothetical protein [Rhizobium favelukesii]UFS85175.1 hypothetical protein LPB79_36420 [Rhizobium sp. T136]
MTIDNVALQDRLGQHFSGRDNGLSMSGGSAVKVYAFLIFDNLIAFAEVEEILGHRQPREKIEPKKRIVSLLVPSLYAISLSCRSGRDKALE